MLKKGLSMLEIGLSMLEIGLKVKVNIIVLCIDLQCQI